MSKLISDEVKRTYQKLMKDLIKDAGQQVDIYGIPEEADCPNCLSDLVTGKSKGVYDTTFLSPTTIFGNVITPLSFSRGRCPVCKGEGKLFNRTPYKVKALIRWNPTAGEMEVSPVGREGHSVVRIKTEPCYYEKVRDSEFIIVDGVRCELIRPPILKGIGKRDAAVVAFLSPVEIGKSTKS